MIYLTVVGIVVLTFFFLFLSVTRDAPWTRPLARLAMALPVVGQALRTVALARCAWALSLTLDTAMDARRAIRLALMSTSNGFFARHGPQVERDVEAGTDLATSLRRTGAFPGDFLDALEVGEQTGRVAESMSALAEDYEQRAKSALSTLTKVAAFAVWVVIFGLIIAVIAQLASFYLNMFNESLNVLP
jgi:type II secretory pathway component PulF